MQLQIPPIIASLIFIAGLVNVASGIWAHIPVRLEVVEGLFPLPFIHLSRTLVVIFGLFLIFLARGLWSRKKLSWQLSTALVTLSILFHLTKGLDFEESAILAVILVALIVFRHLFTIRSSRFGFLQGAKIGSLLLLFWLVFYFLGRRFVEPHTIWFDDAVRLWGFSGVGVLFASLFASFLESNSPTEEQKQKARQLIIKQGQNSSSYLSLMPQTRLFFNTTNTCFLAYRVANGICIVLGDPVGPENEGEDAIKEFLAFATNQGLSTVFYNIDEKAKYLYEDLGVKFIRTGEEAVLTVNEFQLDSPEMKDIRYGVNRMQKLGVAFEWFNLSEVPWRILSQVDALHHQWLKAKKTPPLTFSLNFYPFPIEREAHLLTVHSQERQLLGAFSFLPYQEKTGVVLELMLRNPQAPNGMVEGALAEAVKHFKALGLRELSLGVAPLSNLDQDDSSQIEKALIFIFNNFNQFYGYKSLFAFKEKFKPHWQHKYLAYQNTLELPKITLALIRAHLPKGRFF